MSDAVNGDLSPQERATALSKMSPEDRNAALKAMTKEERAATFQHIPKFHKGDKQAKKKGRWTDTAEKTPTETETKPLLEPAHFEECDYRARCGKSLSPKSSLQALDEALSRPIQQLQLGTLEHVIAIPGARLFGTTVSTPGAALSRCTAGGSGLLKYTFPALAVLHFVWRPILFSLFHALFCLYILLLPAKRLIGRQRPHPKIGPPRLLNIRAKVDHELMSFPSGDSSQAAVVIGTIYVWASMETSLAAAVLLLIPLCMFGRVYFLCHWALDTVVGASLGLAAVALTQIYIGALNVTLTHVAVPMTAVGFLYVGLMVLNKLGVLKTIVSTGNDMA